MKNRYEVKGFGLEEYGVEWGYEYDKDGNAVLCVSDASNRIYDVSSEEEADAICRDLIAQWSADRDN